MILIIEIEQIMLSFDNFYLPGFVQNFIDSIWIQNMKIRNIKNSIFFGKHLFLISYQGLQAVVACLCFAFSIETILSQQFNNHRGREYNKFTYTIFLFNTCLNWEKNKYRTILKAWTHVPYLSTIVNVLFSMSGSDITSDNNF